MPDIDLVHYFAEYLSVRRCVAEISVEDMVMDHLMYQCVVYGFRIALVKSADADRENAPARRYLTHSYQSVVSPGTGYFEFRIRKVSVEYYPVKVIEPIGDISYVRSQITCFRG